MKKRIPDATPTSTHATGLPRGVWMLGFVSLFMDMSSEIIHSLLPLFLVTGLGAGVVAVGLIEGVAEGTASVMKLFSGALSDYLGKRKGLVLLGYGFAALTKPLFPLAGGAGMVLLARFMDRLGKGIRGSPRDALIADLTPSKLRGAAYGLRQALDTTGALLGPLLASLLMVVFLGDFRAVMWVAVIPAGLCVLLIVFGVKEPPRKVRHDKDGSPLARRWPIRGADLSRLGRGFWIFVAIIFALTLVRFSEAFLLLRGAELGLADAMVPLILAALSFAFALSSYPAGVLSDRLGRKNVVIWGFGMMIVADLILFIAEAPWVVFLGAVFWGLHLGLTQGIFSAMVADRVPEDLRGTGFGVFHLVSGTGLFLASLLAGLLWQAFGAQATFLAGAVLALIAVLAFALYYREDAASAP